MYGLRITRAEQQKMSKAGAADHVRGVAAGEGDGGPPGVRRRGVMAVPVLVGWDPPPGSGGGGDAPPAGARARAPAAVHLPAARRPPGEARASDRRRR